MAQSHPHTPFEYQRRLSGRDSCCPRTGARREHCLSEEKRTWPKWKALGWGGAGGELSKSRAGSNCTVLPKSCVMETLQTISNGSSHDSSSSKSTKPAEAVPFTPHDTQITVATTLLAVWGTLCFESHQPTLPGALNPTPGPQSLEGIGTPTCFSPRSPPPRKLCSKSIQG